MWVVGLVRGVSFCLLGGFGGGGRGERWFKDGGIEVFGEMIGESEA